MSAWVWLLILIAAVTVSTVYAAAAKERVGKFFAEAQHVLNESRGDAEAVQDAPERVS